MDRYKYLMQQCELYKKLILALELIDVPIYEKTFKEIQLEYLNEQLTDIGKLLLNLNLKDNKHD